MSTKRILTTLFCLSLATSSYAVEWYESEFTPARHGKPQDTQGWSLNTAGTVINNPSIENNGNAVHAQVYDVFNADIKNKTNPKVLGDYTKMPAIRISIDIKVNSIISYNQETTRQLSLQLRNENLGHQYAYVSAYMGKLSNESGWVTYHVDLYNPSAKKVAKGWYIGGVDELAYNPAQMFHDILSNVTQVAFTTVSFGCMYGYTHYDIEFKNIRIEYLSDEQRREAPITREVITRCDQYS